MISKLEEEEEITTRYPLFSIHSTRFFLCILMTTGLLASTSMRVNLSVGVLCMVNSSSMVDITVVHNISDKRQCKYTVDPPEKKIRQSEKGDLEWSRPMQSILFSATFYGALCTILFTGYAADRFGPKLLLMGAMLDVVLVSFLTPTLAKESYHVFFASRVFFGFGEVCFIMGFLMPCMASLAGRWFVPHEKSTVAAIYTTGIQLGVASASVIVSQLCASDLGWPWIFYFYGSFGLVWIAIWFFFAANKPTESRFINESEKNYITSLVATQSKKHHKVPWSKMLRSKPLLAAILCQFAFSSQATIMQAFLPTFAQQVLSVPITMNGFYSMLPFLVQLIAKNIIAVFADWLKRKQFLGSTQTCKLFQAFGGYGSAICLLLLVLIPNCRHPEYALPILCLYGFTFSTGICGFFTTLLCMAPPYTGTLFSISMTLGMLGNLSGPMLVGALQKSNIQHKWHITFCTCAVINFITATIFLYFGSADVQPWAKSDEAELKAMKEEDTEKINELTT